MTVIAYQFAIPYWKDSPYSQGGPCHAISLRAGASSHAHPPWLVSSDAPKPWTNWEEHIARRQGRSLRSPRDKEWFSSPIPYRRSQLRRGGSLWMPCFSWRVIGQLGRHQLWALSVAAPLLGDSGASHQGKWTRRYSHRYCNKEGAIYYHLTYNVTRKPLAYEWP